MIQTFLVFCEIIGKIFFTKKILREMIIANIFLEGITFKCALSEYLLSKEIYNKMKEEEYLSVAEEIFKNF